MARQLLICSILLINLTVFTINGMEFTLGYLSILISPLLFFYKLSLKKNILFAYLIVFLLDLIRFGFSNQWEFNSQKFILTHFQIFLLFFYSAIFATSKIKRNLTYRFQRTLQFTGYIILISIILQYISFYFLDNSFYNFFGNYQWTYQLILNDFRPKSFYLEPSYLGLVLNSLLLADFLFEEPVFFSRYRILIFLGVLSSLSLFGIVVAFLIVILFYMHENAKKITLTHFIILLSIGSFFILTGLEERFTEITTENTSGFERIGFPLLSIWFMFKELGWYFGVPFGSDFLLIRKISATTVVRQTTLQNSFFLLIINLGVLFIPLLIFYLKNYFKQKNKNRLVLIIIPFLLFNSGGLYSLYYTFFIILIPILSVRISKRITHENITY